MPWMCPRCKAWHSDLSYTCYCPVSFQNSSSSATEPGLVVQSPEVLEFRSRLDELEDKVLDMLEKLTRRLDALEEKSATRAKRESVSPEELTIETTLVLSAKHLSLNALDWLNDHSASLTVEVAGSSAVIPPGEYPSLKDCIRLAEEKACTHVRFVHGVPAVGVLPKYPRE